ncbi:redoxin domain-containing protein [Candidatus Woesearchaeota archaeon]|nr:redoxin domain-containing protein [Candidatus Woesearchaeota archaeon]
MKKTIIFLITILVIISACTTQTQQENNGDNEMVENQEDEMSGPSDVDKDMNKQMNEDKNYQDNSPNYHGNILAGTTSPYIEFNKADYEKAKQQNKIIMLYFYATWCPICEEEQEYVHAAFSELSLDNVVGFRVNYNDGETDDIERELAKKYGIAYQHTKVIIKEGEQVLKAPDSWQKERYLEEIRRVE